MKVTKHMNPDHSICSHSGEWIGAMYTRTIKAATASNLEDMDECQRWCSSIQGQALQLITQLSAKEEMHREMAAEGTDNNLEYVQDDYTNTIQFITGIGVAVSEMSDRLRDARNMLEHDQLRAKFEAQAGRKVNASKLLAAQQ